MQELAADAVVQAHAARHVIHVGAGALAQIGDLVDEGDLGGEEGVGRVFDQLRGAAADIKHRRGVQIKRPVDFGHHGARRFIVAADDDAVRVLEIVDRRAFAQEFRVGDDVHVGFRPHVAQDALDLVAGADRHGRFGHHHRRGRQKRRDLAHGAIDVAQIGVTIAAARRRADRDEDRVGLVDAVGPGGKRKPLLRHVGRHEIGEARLEDRNFAAPERSDPAGILVDAGDVMPEIGETSSRDKADITGADHGDAHKSSASSDAMGNADAPRHNAAPLAGFTRMSEMSDVRQWPLKSARLTRLDTSNFDSTQNLEAENNNQVT